MVVGSHDMDKIKKYKRLDKRERKVYNSKLLASRNIFLAFLCFGSFFISFSFELEKEYIF